MKNINWPQTSLTWLGHASFFFTDTNGNKVYFIDPFQLNNRAKDKADIIFITHAHQDHFSMDDIAQIIKNDTIIVAPSDILGKIDQKNLPADRQVKVEPNQSYNTKGFHFQTIPAYNNHPQKLGFHPKQNKWVGYIFNLNGQKIYHAGDTDFIDEMNALKNLNLDIALLPIGGTYTMDYQEAAKAANAICAKTTIPMHYKNLLGENSKYAEEEFKKLVTNSKVIILQELA